MARIKIDFPNRTEFQTGVTVGVKDLNYGGHVGNDSILTIMHEARMQYIQSLGFKDEISLGDDIGIIVADAAIVYKSEAFYGDHLTIDIGTDEWSKVGFDMFYKLTNEEGNVVALGKTGIVCMNYKTRKVVSVPESLKAGMQN